MLSNSEKINAIAWKARRKGVSYGVLAASLSDYEKAEIYDEYESYWQIPCVPKTKRAAHKDTEVDSSKSGDSAASAKKQKKQ